MAKRVSLKPDDQTYPGMERIRKRLKLSRNTCFRKAVSHYNALCSRKVLEHEYRQASRRLGVSHLDYFRKTEILEDLAEEL